MTIWHNPRINPPPVLTDVLLAVHGHAEAAEGWMHHDGSWTYSTGHELGWAQVYAWTELPACPAIEGVAS